jgi:hypothetical protein
MMLAATGMLQTHVEHCLMNMVTDQPALDGPSATVGDSRAGLQQA